MYDSTAKGQPRPGTDPGTRFAGSTRRGGWQESVAKRGHLQMGIAPFFLIFTPENPDLRQLASESRELQKQGQEAKKKGTSNDKGPQGPGRSPSNAARNPRLIAPVLRMVRDGYVGTPLGSQLVMKVRRTLSIHSVGAVLQEVTGCSSQPTLTV